MKKLTVIIVDDLVADSEVLKIKINEHCSELIVSATCNSIQDAREAIVKYNPVIVFLDINLGIQTGFDLIRDYDSDRPFEVVFMSGHINNPEYLYNAIKSDAIDFLNKPIDPIELKQAVQKSLDRYNDAKTTQSLSLLLRKFDLNKIDDFNLQNKPIILKRKVSRNESRHPKIIRNEVGEVKIIIKDIVYCSSDDKTITFYTVEGPQEKIDVGGSLLYYAKILGPLGFMKIQRSYLVNLNHIQTVLRGDRDIILKFYPDTILTFTKDSIKWQEFLNWWEDKALR